MESRAMKHAADIDLIELAAGRLPPERRQAVEDHLAACEACRKRLAAVAGTWDALGAWAVTPPEVDLAEAVQDAARRHASGEAGAGSWHRVALRLAAAVAIGAGVGHAVARLARAPSDLAAEPDPADVAHSLRLAAFDQGTPTGLAEAVLGIEDSTDEEGT